MREDADLLRHMIHVIAQRLMELNVETYCVAGDVERRISKLRQGSYFLPCLEPPLSTSMPSSTAP